MTTDIFIRTYRNDLNWLKYCLLSIQKFVSGYRKVIVCIPEADLELLDCRTVNGIVVSWIPVCENGYIDQQISKLMAYSMTDAENILFVDSDCYFTRPTDIEEYFIGGRPFLMKTRYELVGDAICWKQPTEEVLGITVEFEYMRRLPLLFKRSTLIEFDKMYDSLSLANRKALSEFNLLGAYAAINQTNEYHIIDTEKEPFPEAPAIQGWSWGGLTEGIENKMKQVLCV
jgi:hypothetical protein